MVVLVRVDDRLLHGQIICAWVPHIKADSLIVASDEAASDSLVAEIIASCGNEDLSVSVMRVNEAVRRVTSGDGEGRCILIVGDLRDAMRVWEEGLRYKALNLGNVHHDDGRRLSGSVFVNAEDDMIIERLFSLGVDVEIRDVPGNPRVEYRPRD